MSQHLPRQIDHLKRMVLALGTATEEAVHTAIHAVQSRDLEAAQRVIDEDRQIDQSEIDVEEECLHTLALHQPVAFDLRFVIAVLKINVELERIADLAGNVAEQARFLAQEERIDVMPYDLPGMSARVEVLLKDSLDALVNVDTNLAFHVREHDREIDQIHRGMYERIEASIRKDPAHTRQYIHLLSVSRHLERMADHCVNIAEDVIYMASGDILRHTHKGQSDTD